MKFKTNNLILSSAILASMSVATVSHAADVLVEDGTPAVIFDDTTTAADGFEWVIRGRDEFFGVFDEVNSYYPIILFPGTNTSRGFERSSAGDVFLAGASLNIDESTNQVGIGTITPQNDLHIASDDPTIRLEDTNGGVTWEINSNTNGATFDIANDTLGVSMLKVRSNAPEDSIVIDDAGIGMGTDSPSHSLHISNNSKDMLLLENTSGSNNIRRLLQMNNNGPVGFEMTDRSQGATWQFRSGSSGDFLVNYAPVSGPELQIDKDNGNMVVKGSVTANGILLTSSKHSKTDIEPIKASDVMEKLKKVEIAEWRYKAADKNDRHISPMAEDFYSLFQLGPDNKHINPNDLASVAIIAAKELQKKSETVSAETAALKAENALLKTQGIQFSAKNDELQARLASLEKLVTNLASSGNLLPANGASIALIKK